MHDAWLKLDDLPAAAAVLLQADRAGIPTAPLSLAALRRLLAHSAGADAAKQGWAYFEALRRIGLARSTHCELLATGGGCGTKAALERLSCAMQVISLATRHVPSSRAEGRGTD